VVIVLVIGSKVPGFIPGRGSCIFKRAIEIRSMTSFGGKVKP
jgi:hypothetical protein